MSTILNTLKKLEEEKSVLDRSLNLKGLVLQTDRAMYPRAEREHMSPGKALVALIVGGIVVGISLGIYLNPEKTVAKSAPIEAQELPVNNQATEPAAPEPAPVVSVQASGSHQRDAAAGIPLASVQDSGTTKLSSASVQLKKTDSVPASPANQELASTTEETADPKTISMDRLPDFHEINAIIDGSKVRKVQPSPSPEARKYNPVSMPSIKMKGIIYFSEKNPANYVLLSGSPDANRKLKVGETVNEATLMEVLPSIAVFSYRGELAQMRIGE